MRHQSICILIVAVTLGGCGVRRSEVSKQREEPKSFFEKKKQCAEAGRRFYEQSKAIYIKATGKDEELANGPFFAYSSERDTCLVTWESSTYSTDLDGKSRSSASGYVIDVFTREYVARYLVISRSGSPDQNFGPLTHEAFLAKRKQLMGFDPTPDR